MIKILNFIALVVLFTQSQFALAVNENDCLNADAINDRSTNCASVAEAYFNKKIAEYSEISTAIWDVLLKSAKRPARMSLEKAQAIAKTVAESRLTLAQLSFNTYKELEPLAVTDESKWVLMRTVVRDNIYMFTEEKFARPVGGVNYRFGSTIERMTSNVSSSCEEPITCLTGPVLHIGMNAVGLIGEGVNLARYGGNEFAPIERPEGLDQFNLNIPFDVRAEQFSE